jgi:hypothetical protein
MNHPEEMTMLSIAEMSAIEGGAVNLPAHLPDVRIDLPFPPIFLR